MHHIYDCVPLSAHGRCRIVLTSIQYPKSNNRVFGQPIPTGNFKRHRLFHAHLFIFWAQTPGVGILGIPSGNTGDLARLSLGKIELGRGFRDLITIAFPDSSPDC